MYIQHLKIENFRGVRDFDCECSQHLNVLVGVNGAGKSTVLNAVNILFSWFVAKLKNAKGNGIVLKDSDITKGCAFCRLEVTLDNGVKWSLFRQHSSVRTKPTSKTYLREVTEYANDIVENDRINSTNIPLYAQYGVTRVVDSTLLRVHKKHALGKYDIYNKEMGDKMNFQTFFSWFREKEDIENEQLRETRIFIEDPQLQAVRHAIALAVPGFDQLKVQRRTPKGFVVEKEGEKFFFNQLSDGEKSYIALIADIARKLSMTHPNSNSPLDETGVILVDEVDLHLHPTWQRDIIPQLRSVFNGCQLFISTHSPYVLTNINKNDGDNIFLLKDGQAVLWQQNMYGSTVDKILLEILQQPSLRGKHVQEHIDKIWDSLRNHDCTSETYINNLNWLKENLNPSDIELVRIAIQQRKLCNPLPQ